MDDVLFVYHNPCMPRFATLTADADIAASILKAPGWARVGITMPDRDLRERAAGELARSIVEQLSRSLDREDGDQLQLPI